MSTELVIRIWDQAPPTHPGERLLQLIDVVEGQGTEGSRWQGVTVRSSDRVSPIRRVSEPLSRDDIARHCADFEVGAMHFSTRIAVPCWRFHEEIPTHGAIVLWVESWARDYVHATGRDYDAEGDAALGFASVGPFCALQSPSEHPRLEEVNLRVEENLERMLDLLMQIANALHPLAMKVFNDQGLYQPLNAHLAFFRDPALLLRDIAFLQRLWNEGLPAYNTPPLKDSQSRLDRVALHPWRDESAQRALLSRLQEVIENTSHLEPAHLDLLDWEQFDCYDGEAGRMVLEYPDFVNAFLDRFYLAIMTLPRIADVHERG